ncbi:MAG: homogentisate 1,2-dioxygenase [Candidatus Eisenbacteria bacterium]
MPIYRREGEIPPKRHTQFRRPDGGLYYEELIGTEGFSGISSLVYHLRRPTQVRSARRLGPVVYEASEPGPLRHRHVRTRRIPEGGDPWTARRPLFWNADVVISVARPTQSSETFFRDSQGEELIYVSEGSGALESIFGDLPYGKGDYLVIPRGTIHRFRCDPVPHHLLVVESRGHVRTPKRYRNSFGQLLEHSPFCERDIRTPRFREPRDETGEFEIRVKQGDAIHAYLYAAHPFDAIGWDGYYYPWAMQISDFEPITGRIHQPPPVHQTFEGDGFVVCSFVPRLYDYHPDSIPTPYHHANVGSDEILYYASDRFMSRKGIEHGSITLHPDGLPHGPHPGTIEASLGARETDELAVMIDTFRPLTVGREAEAIEDESYLTSWLEPGDRPSGG